MRDEEQKEHDGTNKNWNWRLYHDRLQRCMNNIKTKKVKIKEFETFIDVSYATSMVFLATDKHRKLNELIKKLFNKIHGDDFLNYVNTIPEEDCDYYIKEISKLVDNDTSINDVLNYLLKKKESFYNKMKKHLKIFG